jgi:aryl-alcohol dehydrogenase-like predicted oxidoreductase
MKLPSGKMLSRIIFGGDRLQARRYLVLPSASRRRELFALLDAAMELGINTFDTARAYGDSEHVLGAWMRERRNRDAVALCTKVACPRRGRSRLTPGEMRSDLHKSLRALETDHVDILLPHYDDPEVDVESIMRELSRFVEEGKAGVIGASNWDYRRVQSANQIAATSDLHPFSAVSVNFGLLPWNQPPWPGAVQISGPANEDARAFFTDTQMPVLVWSSLGFGFFSDDYDPNQPKASIRSRWIASVFGSRENHERLRRARELAQRSGASAAQVALAFILSQGFPTHCIVGCRSHQKLEDCVGALKVQLGQKALESFQLTDHSR